MIFIGKLASVDRKSGLKLQFHSYLRQKISNELFNETIGVGVYDMHVESSVRRGICAVLEL